MTKRTERRARRTGCSCWGVLLYGAFGVLCLGVIAFLVIREYTTHKAMSSLSAAEQAEFKAWLTETHEVTEDWLNDYKPVPADVLRDKITLYDDLDNARDLHGIDLGTGHYAAIRRDLMGGATIAPALLAEAVTSTSVILPLFERLHELVSRDGYRFSNNDNLVPIKRWSSFRQLYARLYVEVANDETAAAIGHMDTLLRALHDEPILPDHYLNIQRELIDHIFALTTVIEARTSSPQTVENLVQIYESNRAVFLIDLRNTGLLNDSLAIMQAMRHDAYPHTPPAGVYTNEQLFSHVMNALDYFLWLHPKLPTSDPRKETMDNMFKSPKPPALTLNNLTLRNLSEYAFSTFGIKFYFQSMMLFSGKEQQIYFWKSTKQSHEANLAIHARYHLTRLWLARRVAELRGEALPVSQSDFVPRYLPEWPADPYSPTGDGFQFNAETGEFFSVGPDGAPGTDDDILHIEKPKPEEGEPAPVPNEPDTEPPPESL